MQSKTSKGKEQEQQWLEYITGPAVKTESFSMQWEKFNTIYAHRPLSDGPAPAWFPQLLHGSSNLKPFMEKVGTKSFSAFQKWSVENKSAFWQLFLKELPIHFENEHTLFMDTRKGVKDVTWLKDSIFNIAFSCLNHSSEEAAVVVGSEESGALKTYRYKTLKKDVERFAAGLVKQGFKPNDAIALYMPMNYNCIVAYLAIILIGARVVSIADSFSALELKSRLEIAQAKAIISCDYYYRAGKKIELYEKIKKAQSCLAIIESKSNNPLRKGDIYWQEIWQEKQVGNFSGMAPNHIINILFSSGTTGTPKAIPWPQTVALKCAMDGYFHQNINTGNVVAWPTNIGWMMGPWLIFATLLNKGTIALYEGGPATSGFVDFIEKAKVEILGVIPSIVKAWRSKNSVKYNHWPALKIFSSTGEPSNREDYLWLLSRAGYRAPVIEYLGGTEIGGGHLTGSVEQAQAPATFSTPALGISFEILKQNGTPCKENDSGELFLHPPALGLSQSLLNRNHNSVYYPSQKKGVSGHILRKHGDEIACLAQGYYKAQGRADDTMNLGGIKVSSVEIETVVNQHNSVYESAAISTQPGGEGSEALVLFIVAKGQPSADLKEDLGKQIAIQLNPLFKIWDMVFSTTLPRTASGKLMRRELRNRYEK